jgi:acylphosphatase
MCVSILAAMLSGMCRLLFVMIRTMTKNLQLKIYGDVQGVGFRDAIYWMARKMYIGGFVMNEPDGTVFVEAEGEEAILKTSLENTPARDLG